MHSAPFQSMPDTVLACSRISPYKMLCLLSHCAEFHSISYPFRCSDFPFETIQRELELIPIPAGSFQMGSPNSEKDRKSNETQHNVIISKAFYMGKFLSTQEQYQALTGKAPSAFKGAKNPVEQVSWDEAQEFCEAINNKFH